MRKKYQSYLILAARTVSAMGPAGSGGVRVGSPGVLMTLLLKEVTTYLQQLVPCSREAPPPLTQGSAINLTCTKPLVKTSRPESF